MNSVEGLSFEEALRQVQWMEQPAQPQVQQEPFSTDDINPHRLRVTNPDGLLGRPLNKIEAMMLQNIEAVDEYAWSRGSRGGLDTGWELFNDAIEGGLQPGLILFAAAPNVGKSAMMLQIAKTVSERNENVYVSYHSLDDSNNELLPRYIACDQQIKIAQAKMPEKFSDQPEIIEKRNEGLRNLYRNIYRFGMYDSENLGTSVEAIEQHIKDILMELPEGVKLVICIDSFNDLTVESQKFSNNDARNEYVAKMLKSWTVRYNAVVMCTAHLRKTNGKRPTVDDLKDTIRLQYEANLILLLYNEVGIKEENAAVYWMDEEEETKMPVIECKFAKNKFSSFKGTRFYEFFPDFSFMIEAPIEACRRYASLIYQG
ncbi:DnaB-like helicase C-terminal domain-containing protein [Alicyclobacillus shizuokensis]|uniref:DnaB-like helicase C-terminal domain-containing protein n=1 Tax=Alicyclobacillus shizuokensis TaxID=392014 RepID=UPI001FDFA294|nr:DnaB-like helicase C-terminal domain-containing protein [Alicyclobacillus shizuokensis]